FIPWTYVVIGAMYYITFSQGGTLLWLVPYSLVIFSLPLALKLKGRPRILLLCLYTSMAEQVTVNILSISVLNLVGGFWLGVWPLMYFERTLATVVGTSTVVGLKSGLGTRFEIAEPLRMEVRR